MTCERLLFALLLSITTFGACAAEPLQYKVITAGEISFGVNATLLTGSHDALLIDSGFTRADAYRIENSTRMPV